MGKCGYCGRTLDATGACPRRYTTMAGELHTGPNDTHGWRRAGEAFVPVEPGPDAEGKKSRPRGEGSRMGEDYATEVARILAKAIADAEEREARRVAIEWLPLALRWMVDHPRLLRWYMRLPHRSMPMCEIRSGELIGRWSIQRKG